MKVAILLSSLRCGGTERTVSILANAWTQLGWQVDILTLSGPEVPPFFELNRHVRHVPLGLLAESRNKLQGAVRNLGRIWQIRKALRSAQPHVLVAFMEGTTALALLAAAGTGVPVVVSEVAVPALQTAGPIWNLLRRVLYPRAARLVVPSQGVANFFRHQLGLEAAVIPNPVPIPPTGTPPSCTGNRLIAAGRLSPEKGFALLIQAFSLLRKTRQNLSLTIFGEGPERAKLEELVRTLDLTEDTSLPGNSNMLAQEMRAADLFVLSSEYEGFGNVICEALSVGLPVISFDCPTGPREIIRDGIDGVLVPAGDVAALATGIAELLDTRSKLQALSRNGPEILERFGLDRIAQEWVTVFNQVSTSAASNKFFHCQPCRGGTSRPEGDT